MVYFGGSESVTPGAQTGRREEAGPAGSDAAVAPRDVTETGDVRDLPDAYAEPAGEVRMLLAFAPIHKRAFGFAVGAGCATLVAALTLAHLLIRPEQGPRIELLANYFYGYQVSWTGLAVGSFWAFIAGFVGGWFVAFCRNLALATAIFITRTRAELSQTRDFLDHI